MKKINFALIGQLIGAAALCLIIAGFMILPALAVIFGPVEYLI